MYLLIGIPVAIIFAWVMFRESSGHYQFPSEISFVAWLVVVGVLALVAWPLAVVVLIVGLFFELSGD